MAIHTVCAHKHIVFPRNCSIQEIRISYGTFHLFCSWYVLLRKCFILFWIWTREDTMKNQRNLENQRNMNNLFVIWHHGWHLFRQALRLQNKGNEHCRNARRWKRTNEGKGGGGLKFMNKKKNGVTVTTSSRYTKRKQSNHFCAVKSMEIKDFACHLRHSSFLNAIFVIHNQKWQCLHWERYKAKDNCAAYKSWTLFFTCQFVSNDKQKWKEIRFFLFRRLPFSAVSCFSAGRSMAAGKTAGSERPFELNA